MNLLSKFFHKLRHRPATNQHELLCQRYKQHCELVAGHILQDADAGYVSFILNGKDSQVHCTFQWFASVTDGGGTSHVIALRHAMLTALNILNVRHGYPYFSEDTPMPLFVTIDGEPCVQYLFWGKSHVRCERYDKDIAEAIAEEAKTGLSRKTGNSGSTIHGKESGL